MSDDNEFQVRPGRSRDSGLGSGGRPQSLAAQVRRAAARSGYARSLGPAGRRSRRAGVRGRGRNALLRIRRSPNARRVTVVARVVRHKGARFRAAPLARHVAYLKRDGVTRDGRDAGLFDARDDHANGDAFAERCHDDRHHFRLIVSPEDGRDLSDLRAFTRDLMDDVARDLDTALDWVAVDHWNTDNPHVHILIRGRADDGADLVIDGGYIQEGVRGRAEARATLELGQRSEHDIHAALEREVEADRWTSLDQRLEAMAHDVTGTIDLRPGNEGDESLRLLLCGRVAKLQRLGLAEMSETGLWTLRSDAETTLRDLAVRSDVIKTIHRAMREQGYRVDPAGFALHAIAPSEPIVGRLVKRGLDDELDGTAYAIVDGADGRAHHLRFDDLEMTGDATPGAIVELRSWSDAKGRNRLSLATRSDLSLDQQVTARGATWLDRQLVAATPIATANGFGADVRAALDARASELEAGGLATRHASGFRFERGLIETLRKRELDAVIETLAKQSGLQHRPSNEGDYVSGIYRQRVTLASGRFAMVDDGMGFQLVPWRPALEPHLGAQITGTMGAGGRVEWSLGRGKGLGL